MRILILEEMLGKLHDLYQAEGLKPGLLLKVGLKAGWNVVIGTDGQCGMAMSFTGSEEAFGKPKLDMPRLQTFMHKSLFEVAANYIGSESWQERSIGVAAMTALSQPLITPAQLKKRHFEVSNNSGGYNSLIKKDDIVAVVGYGGGVSRMLGTCKELHVTDMRPRTAFQTVLITDRAVEYAPREVFVHPEKENKEVIGKASVVIVTGSSLVNGTFEELLSYRRNPRLTIVYGASAAMIPDVLFEHGVDSVHASRISDPVQLEIGMMNEMNMEAVMQRSQESQMIGRPAK